MNKNILIISLIVALFLSAFVVQRSITGNVTGMATVNVTSIVMISLQVNSVDFGTVSQGSTKDTATNSPPPFLLKNDGTVNVDVTINRDPSSTPLFSGTGAGDNTTSFQFKADFPVNQTNPFDYGSSLTNWTNVPGVTPLGFIRNLGHQVGGNLAEVDLRINVPSDESPGSKTELIDFIGTQTSFSNCLHIDASGAYRSGSTVQSVESVDMNSENSSSYVSCIGIVLTNTCNSSISITKAKINWSYASNDLKYVNIGSGPSEWRWSDSCNWGCSPNGEQPPNTLLDFGTRDYSLSSFDSTSFKLTYENYVQSGMNIVIELYLSDGSSSSSGLFTV